MLTVTDNDGATTSLTKPVSVTVGPNQPPIASFTAVPTNLSVALNASGSADPDGVVVSYAWTFGDGTTDVGVTPTHVYASAGTYTVTLTVTDAAGATGATSRSLFVVTAGSVIANDAFTRTAANAWGTSDAGGAWSLTGSASYFSVNGSVGSTTMPTAGTSCVATLASVSALNFNATVDTSLDKAAAGNGAYATLIGRQVGKYSYQLKERFLPGGVVHLVLSKVVNGTETIFKEVNITGLTYNPGDLTRVRFQITTSGTSTTLAGKVWKVGTAEPTAALISQVDSEPTLQAAGAFALQTSLSGTMTNVPAVMTYDNLLITTS